MKAIFFALGSRGDIEPLFSLGEHLRKKNWEVLYVFPEQFRVMVELTDAKFYGFTKAFIDALLESEQSKIITSKKGSAFSRIKTLYQLGKKSLQINKEVTLQQKEIINIEKPDYVFFNQKCVYPIVWGMQGQNKSIFVHPFPCFLHSVDEHSIIGFSGGGNYGKILNRLSYLVQVFSLSAATYFTTRKLLKGESKFKTNPLKIRKHLLQRILSIYTVSPTLFSPPSKWQANAKVVGFVERDKTQKWEPSITLRGFLKAHNKSKVLFATFGSISNTDPLGKTKAIISAIEKYKTPTIINTSWGGLIEVEDCPEHVLFVKDIPYDWIFPKVYGVIHHGGAGTTHSAIKYGCASLIIPHFIDQFFWSDLIVDLKAGPKGPSIKRLNTDNFEQSLLELITNESFKRNAEALSGKMQNKFDLDGLLEDLQYIAYNKILK